jgi:hypothetical protein
VNDLREELDENAFDLKPVNSDSVSNQIIWMKVNQNLKNKMQKEFKHGGEL